jgi:hypothetical protein
MRAKADWTPAIPDDTYASLLKAAPRRRLARGNGAEHLVDKVGVGDRNVVTSSQPDMRVADGGGTARSEDQKV